MKKSLARILVAAMLLSLFGGFSLVAHADEVQEVKLSLVSYRELQTDPIPWYEGEVYKWIFDQIEERYGYRITLEYDRYDEDKLNLMFTSGELPDIVYFYSANQAQTVLENEYALNLAPLMEEYAPHMLEPRFEQRNALMQSLAGGSDNGLYFIPITFGIELADGGIDSIRGYTVNWAWYKEIGAPEIVDDDSYIEALKAIVEAHPTNEEGKPVYAYGYYDNFSQWTQWRAAFTNESLVNPWTLSGYLYSEGLDDNVLYNGYTDTERSTYWQEMRFANKIYKAGLLDPDSFTQTSTEFSTKRNAHQYAGISSANVASGYDVVPAPGAFFFANKIHLAGYYPDQQVFVSADSKNWKAALAWIDFMHTDEAQRALFSGIQGVHWDYDANGVPTLFPETIAMKAENGDALKYSGVGITTPIRITQPAVLAADGYPLSLFETEEMRIASMNDLQKDLSEYYGVAYPSMARKKLFDEGMIIDHSKNFSQLTAIAREPIPTDILRILTKCNDVMYAAIPELVMAEDDDAFAAVQARVMDDLKKVNEPEAWAWITEAQAAAHAIVDPIIWGK